jgi:acetyl-CoA synthetase
MGRQRKANHGLTIVRCRVRDRLDSIGGSNTAVPPIVESHEIKGQAIAAFVTPKDGTFRTRDLVEDLKKHVVRKIGAIARPDDVMLAADLPKTRSVMKIMRRLLRDIAEGKALGDTTTADPSVVAKLKATYEGQHG